MGIARCCFGHSSPRKLPKEQSNFREFNDPAATDLKSSIIQFMKVRCLWTRNEAQKDALAPPDNKEATLGECLLSSPLPGSSYTTNADDQFYVFRPLPFNRVHPALAVDYYAYNNPNGRYSTERLLISDDGVADNSEADFYSSRRSQSGITKKRVSFKLPEEADIFVYNLPDDDIDGEEPCVCNLPKH